MKSIQFLLCILGVFGSCTPELQNPAEMDLKIRLIGTPQCNGSKSADESTQTPPSRSCVEFAFDRDNRKLIIKHLNAGFNCCPESLWCTVAYRNDTILIQEFEKHAGCKCNCLYNLDIEVEGLEPGKYQLRLIEPYLGTQQPIIGFLDLLSQKQSNLCASRSIYPWYE